MNGGKEYSPSSNHRSPRQAHCVSLNGTRKVVLEDQESRIQAAHDQGFRRKGMLPPESVQEDAHWSGGLIKEFRRETGVLGILRERTRRPAVETKKLVQSNPRVIGMRRAEK